MRSILLSRVDRREKDLLKNYFMQGFAPADEVLLFRQKDPKPFPPVRVPGGKLRPGTELYGSETRSAQTVLAEESNSAPRLRRARRREDTQETIQFYEGPRTGNCQNEKGYAP